MKGLIFREFLGMVEQKYDYETVDHIIESSDLQSKGIYTSVGTYPHSEIFKLIDQLSLNKNISADKLLFSFGQYAFKVFAKSYPSFFEHKKMAFDILSEIDNKIHVEVLKLYPEAELPNFSIEKHTTEEMIMIYTSIRKMSSFAEGLIQGCLSHFKENAIIEKDFLKKDGSKVSFRIKMVNG